MLSPCKQPPHHVEYWHQVLAKVWTAEAVDSHQPGTFVMCSFGVAAAIEDRRQFVVCRFEINALCFSRVLAQHSRRCRKLGVKTIGTRMYILIMRAATRVTSLACLVLAPCTLSVIGEKKPVKTKDKRPDSTGRMRFVGRLWIRPPTWERINLWLAQD